MNFALDDDVYALADAVGDVLKRHDGAPPGASASEPVHRRWTALCELGLLGLMLPEPDGMGIGLLEASLVAERLGQSPLVGPAVPAMVLVAGWSRHGGGGEFVSELLSGKCVAAFNTVDRITLSDGTASGTLRVPADGVTEVLAALSQPQGSERAALVLLDVAAVAPGQSPHPDVLRPMRSVEFKDVKPLATCDVDTDAASRLRDELIILQTAELVGGMSRVVADTVEFVTQRQQFGRSVGSFQAVKHQLADMYCATEQARAAVQFAAISVVEGTPTRVSDVNSVRRWVPPAAAQLFETAIHLHGAMGFSWELDTHLHLRRAMALSAQLSRGSR